MDRLYAMELFIAAVDEGSLAAAARRFGRTAVTATRAVALAEQIAGEPLMLRSTRALKLTPAGERTVAVWRDVLARLAEAHSDDEPKMLTGTLTVTAPELFGQSVALSIIEAFMVKHPRLVVRATFSNPLVDMVKEGIDVAIRLAHLPDSNLMAIRLGDIRQITCASPDYLAQHGTPLVPADLESHECIGINSGGDAELWQFSHEGASGKRKSRAQQVRTRLSLSSAGGARDAAVRGFGVTRRMCYQVADDIVAGRLTVLLAGFEPPPLPVNLVFRAGVRKSSPTRQFVDFATPLLRRELDRIALLLS